MSLVCMQHGCKDKPCMYNMRLSSRQLCRLTTSCLWQHHMYILTLSIHGIGHGRVLIIKHNNWNYNLPEFAETELRQRHDTSRHRDTETRTASLSQSKEYSNTNISTYKRHKRQQWLIPGK